MNWIESAVGLVYPHNCAFCGCPLPEEDMGWICEPCLSRVQRIASPCCSRCGGPFDGEFLADFECSRCSGMTLFFETTICACRATGIVRECIHRFKYQRQLFLERHLGDWLADCAAHRIEWSCIDLVVPVPLHPRREREREFNQAQILAGRLGKQFGKPVCSNQLCRIRDTPSQTHLDREERQRNVHGAFVVKPTAKLQGCRIALVDDVFTTGATTSECARILKQAGADRVLVLTVARG